MVSTAQRNKWKTPKPNSGRPDIEIDMKIVDDLLVQGANGAQISAYLGICDDTLYLRIQKEYGILWSDYAAKKRSKGDAMLHSAQFKKAVRGDNTQLIWLGKNRLGQRDGEDKYASPANDKDLTTLLASIKSQPPLIALQEELKSLREQLDAIKQQANHQLQRGEQALQHMGGSGSFGEDVCEHPKAD
jgi:transposase-like protein